MDIAKLHDTDIIHGDLTTSNMILVEKNTASQINDLTVNLKDTILTNIAPKKNLPLNKSSAKESGGVDFKASHPRAKGECIFFIDFGLGFISHKFEDKAVDIHLLKQALEAKHFKHWETLYKEFLKGYKTSKNSEKTLTQLNKVEKRGRYKC